MSKSRRKASGCKRGHYKLKRMGKGWLAMRKGRGSEPPIDRKAKDAAEAERKAAVAAEQAGTPAPSEG